MTSTVLDPDPDATRERSPPCRRRRRVTTPTVTDANRARRGGLQGFLRGRERRSRRGCGPRCSGCSSRTGVLYLWGLGASGWANTLLLGGRAGRHEELEGVLLRLVRRRRTSSPSTSRRRRCGSMALSARIFGVNSWSILVPQALEGVAAVGVLYADGAALVHAPAAGLIAGAVLALTPVAALMFRFNNPDALLVLLLTRRRLRDDAGARGRPHAVAGRSPVALVGFGFLTKMLQAFLVLPGVRARVPARRRRRRCGGASGSCSWPASRCSCRPAGGSPSSSCGRRRRRPYIGGSQNNSVLELIFGYNGFGRLTGNETGSVGGGGGQRRRPLGPDRLDRACSTPSSAARSRGCSRPRSILLVAGLVLTRRAPAHRPHPRRAAAVGRLAARHRRSCSASARASSTRTTRSPWPRRSARSSASARAVLWQRRARSWRRVVLAGRRRGHRVVGRRAARPHARLEPVAAPARARRAARGRRACCSLRPRCVRGRGAACGRRARGRRVARRHPRRTRWRRVGHAARRRDPDGRTRPVAARAGRRRRPGGGPGGVRRRRLRRPACDGRATPRRRRGRRSAAGGGAASAACSTAARPSADAHRAARGRTPIGYTWVAAAVGANQAAGYQLATDEPVMAIGGFNGTDPTPTLAQFQQYVPTARSTTSSVAAASAGGGSARRRRSSSTSTAIAPWVSEHFTARPSAA